MKLYVDDIRQPPDDSWTIARSVSSAINAVYLFHGEITEISLDHDISHQVVVNGMSRPYPCIETFTAVAQAICLMKKADPAWAPNIKIATSNRDGARRMKALLEEAGLSVNATVIPGANRLEMEVHPAS